jgi:hypothetical protein
MILPRYHIADSSIRGAGKGLFLDEIVAAGRVITAPDRIERTFRHAEITASPELSAQFHASARWFEDYYTLSPDWPDECYINHSFTPNGLWHLGFRVCTGRTARRHRNHGGLSSPAAPWPSRGFCRFGHR